MNTITLLDRLVAFPTVSGETNLPMVGFIQSYLEERGFSCRLIADDSGAKANLFASIGPDSDDGIILSGHTDVVPCAAQAWTSDPFRLNERNGKLFGRGAADMKGFLACMLTVADLASKSVLSRPLHLAFSHDEEIGCVGVRSMLDDLVKRQFRAAFCIVGEPTAMRVVTGHKGKLAARATCFGMGGHSSCAPLYLNAIHMATDVVSLLRQAQDEFATAGAQDDAYEVPYTTIHAGRIAGGVAVNVVASEAMVDFEIRHLVADDPCRIIEDLRRRADVLAEALRPRFPQARVSIDIVNAYPGLDLAKDVAAGLLAGLADQPYVAKVSFGTEAGLFMERLAIPTLVLGPGSMEQGHTPDEFIEMSELERCDAFLKGVLERLIG
jgi:acetylornithine deacetylase